jgi:hypothetical protein
MPRLLAVVGAIVLLAGCQSQGPNPFAGVGPSTIPPPSGAAPGNLPYYPPAQSPATTPPTITLPGSTSFAPPATSPALSRTNISVSPSTANPSAGGPVATTFASDPADRQPIRVVEAPAATTRAAINAQPVTGNSIRQPVEVSQVPKNGYAPTGTSPAYNHMRGFPTPPEVSPAAPAGTKPPLGQSTRGVRTDRSVAPAGFVEPVQGSGTWRSR